jgi:8-oxo-dGTP diphosphatase
MTFAHLPAEQIEQSLIGQTRQYLVGSLSKEQILTHIDDGDIEVGISDYVKACFEPAHRHSVAREYQYILCGLTEYMDVDTGEVRRFKKGDFYVIYPGTSYIQRIKRNTRILFFKFPGGNDKKTVETDARVSDWANSPLVVERRDLKAGTQTPVPNSLRPAVAAAVFDNNGRLLLVKRKDSGFWAMPGGTLRMDENVESCAIREVHEETGVDISVAGIIGTYTNPANVVAYSDGEVRREFSVLFACVPRTFMLRVDEESTEAVWAEATEIDQYPMVDSQRLRIADAVKYQISGNITIR